MTTSLRHCVLLGVARVKYRQTWKTSCSLPPDVIYLLNLVSRISEPEMLNSLFSSSEQCSGDSAAPVRENVFAHLRPCVTVSVSVFPSNCLSSLPHFSRLVVTDSDHHSSDLPLSSLPPPPSFCTLAFGAAAYGCFPSHQNIIMNNVSMHIQEKSTLLKPKYHFTLHIYPIRRRAEAGG